MVVHMLEQRFDKWACDRLTEDGDFGKKIIISDEAHFDTGTYVNKQKTRRHALKSRRSQNESIFAEDFGPDAQLGNFFRK